MLENRNLGQRKAIQPSDERLQQRKVPWNKEAQQEEREQKKNKAVNSPAQLYSCL